MFKGTNVLWGIINFAAGNGLEDVQEQANTFTARGEGQHSVYM